MLCTIEKVVSTTGYRRELWAGSTVYLLSIAAKPAIDCISPNLLPVNIMELKLENNANFGLTFVKLDVEMGHLEGAEFTLLFI